MNYGYLLFLKGSLGKTLAEVRPTIFLGVPRVWEKMQEKMVEVGRSSGFMRRKIAAWAKDIGLRGNLSKMEGYVACSLFLLSSRVCSFFSFRNMWNQLKNIV